MANNALEAATIRMRASTWREGQTTKRNGKHGLYRTLTTIASPKPRTGALFLCACVLPFTVSGSFIDDRLTTYGRCRLSAGRETRWRRRRPRLRRVLRTCAFALESYTTLNRMAAYRDGVPPDRVDC